MNTICCVCKQPININQAELCYACRYLVHPECIISSSHICQECWFAGMACKKADCLAYHAGVCLAEKCNGVVDKNKVMDLLRIDWGTHSIAERALLYNKIQRQFYYGGGAISSAQNDKPGPCPHSECLAYEKTLCLASMCFGSVIMPKLASLTIRARVYDDYVLREIARRPKGQAHYTMICAQCGADIHCSGDAARHYQYYGKKPVCRDCRK